MKVVIFSGAGVSAESNIYTFRDIKNGLWYNHNVDEVATLAGWKKNRELVLEFHNRIRADLVDKVPNEAHHTIASWEKEHEVTVITQNVDSLHEMAGSTNVLHLHGELNKSRSTYDDEIYDIDGITLNIGEKCPNGSQLRPHTVLFDEYPYNIGESANALAEADVLIIVGTSLRITYTLPLIYESINDNTKVYYIDPQPNTELSGMIKVNYIKEKASIGIKKVKI